MAMHIVIGIVLGAAAGAALGSTRSCSDGGCPLTSTPKRGALYGAFIGFAFASMTGAPTQAKEESKASPHMAIAESEEAFDAKLDENEGTTVVYFHAVWCGACRTYGPALDEIAKDNQNQASFLKVDVDKVPELAKRFKIKALPTTVVLKGSQETSRFIGAVSHDTIEQAIQTET